jgi:hypothetical protein
MGYIIGAGAILEAGERGGITPAAVHARVDPALAERVTAAAIDFESTGVHRLQRLLVLASGWDAEHFRNHVTTGLLGMQTCSLADVLLAVASARGAAELHCFAHWLPDERTYAALQNRGVELIAHPLETIESAAIVSGRRFRRWPAMQAA